MDQPTCPATVPRPVKKRSWETLGKVPTINLLVGSINQDTLQKQHIAQAFDSVFGAQTGFYFDNITTYTDRVTAYEDEDGYVYRDNTVGLEDALCSQDRIDNLNCIVAFEENECEAPSGSTKRWLDGGDTTPAMPDHQRLVRRKFHKDNKNVAKRKSNKYPSTNASGVPNEHLESNGTPNMAALMDAIMGRVPRGQPAQDPLPFLYQTQLAYRPQAQPQYPQPQNAP